MNADFIDLEELQRTTKDIRTEAKMFFTSFSKDIQEGDYLDYVDSRKKWKAAKLITKDQTNIGTLKPLGWPNTSTERLPLINTRIRPFRNEAQLDTSTFSGEFEKNENQLLTELVLVFSIQPGNDEDRRAQLPSGSLPEGAYDSFERKIHSTDGRSAEDQQGSR